MTSVAAGRYAKALLEISLGHVAELKPDDALAQLRAFEDIMARSTDLRRVLLTPAVAGARKRAVLERLAGPLGFAPLMRNFFFVLTNHHRLDQVSQIREAFEEFLDEQRGLLRASVVSAQPLGEDEARLVEKKLGALTGRMIRARYAVDQALVGGVVARIGSTVYDGSVHGHLQALRDKLTAGAGM